MNPISHSIVETNPSILIIDDEPAIRDMLVFALSERGYRASAAATGEEGIQKAREGSIDLVIVDMKMAGTDGVEILKAIKKYSPDTAAIVITGYPDLETTVQSMRLGVFDYIAKPFDLNQIFQAVQKAIEQRRRACALTSTEETNRLQSELLLHMSHKLKAAIENTENQSKMLLQLVNDTLDLPKRSSRLPNSRLEWQDILNRLERLDKPQSKANVLVVDDDPCIVELLEYMLAREGYKVESIRDSQAALDHLTAHRPDFLILDLMMPKLNGFEILDAIAKIPSLKDLPIVILTARYLSSDEKKDLQKRVERIVRKGQADIEEILAVLNEHSCAFRSLSAA